MTSAEARERRAAKLAAAIVGVRKARVALDQAEETLALASAEAGYRPSGSRSSYSFTLNAVDRILSAGGHPTLGSWERP